MKLVAQAQANNGVLDDQQAMRTINGLSGPTPPPRLMGLELPEGIVGMPALSTAATAPPAALPTRPAPAPPPGAFGAVPDYPPLVPDKASSYQTAFEQLDGDHDGYVQGVDCFPALMRSGLPKDILKSIWDVVAGDEGQLNRHQFVQCLYLVDCAKIGIPVPAVLPPGQFPPSQGAFGLQSMVGRSQQQQDIYQSGQLGVAPMPQRAVYVPGAAPAVAFQSQVPPAPTSAQAAGLAAAEAARLHEEREEALRQEQQRQRAEEERVAAAARREYYTQALASLRLAQSKVARTLNEAQQRLEMEQREAEGMENQYNSAYEAFSTEHARAAPVLEALKRVEDEKSELGAKMAALQAAVAQLEEYDPEWEKKEQAECEGMQKEITKLTVHHETLQQARAAVLAQRGTLETAIEAVKDAAERAQTSVDALSTEISELSTEAKKNGATVVELLKRLAPLYNELYTAAKDAMVPLPKEALATIVRPAASNFKYDPLRFAHTATSDWDMFTDEGFTITATVGQDARLVSLTSSSLAKAEEEESAEASAGKGDGADETEEVGAVEEKEGIPSGGGDGAEAVSIVDNALYEEHKDEDCVDAGVVVEAAEEAVESEAPAAPEATTTSPTPETADVAAALSDVASPNGAKAVSEEKAATGVVDAAAAAVTTAVEGDSAGQ
ncbi:hypothetical protein Ndes2526B_g07333 [Nannochloris sp. 'desiccata']